MRIAIQDGTHYPAQTTGRQHRQGGPGMPSSYDPQTWGAVSPVYERLLTHCSPLRLPVPWDFLQAPAHCRGPVSDPAAALADLRARFDEATLQAAAVLSSSPKEGSCLSPLFASP